MDVNEKSRLLAKASDVEAGNHHKHQPCKGSRSGTRFKFGIFSYFVLTILGILAFTTAILRLQQAGVTFSKSKQICTSATCVHAASGILYNLSPDHKSLDACENFDEFVCGGFRDHHDLRPDQSDIFTGTLMAEEGQATLRHILESDGSGLSSADKTIFAKLRNDYTACMDEKTIQDQGLGPLKALLYGLRNDTGGNFTNGFSYLYQLGVDALVSLYVGADDKFPEVQIVQTSPAGLGLPSKEYYKNNKTTAEYRDVINAVLPKIVPEFDFSNNDSLPSAGEGILAFETSIASFMPEEEDLNDITKSYNKLTMNEVEEMLPQVNLKQVISALAPSDYTAESVIVVSPDFARNLSELIQNTDSLITHAYLAWRLLTAYSSRAEDSLLQPLKRFNNKLQGKEPDAKPDRWRRCVSAADNDLGWILSKFYVDKAFSPEAKTFGDQIVSDIKGSFVNFLGKAKWMTKENRDRAITKVHAIDQKIGYPTSNPDVLDPAALEAYYSTLTIGNASFLVNGEQVAAFEVRQEWVKLGKPTRHDEWGMTVPTVNAYYNPPGNEIVFPAGIMQSPVFYDPSAPQYLSYGAFGAVSGHELSHAFDNTGSQYDETGKYNDWWSNETRVAFEEKTECFVKQYANYTITSPDGEEIHVNGRLTLGENVADAGGVHAAFDAWIKRATEKPKKHQKKPNNLLLPGLEHFTQEQLFFVNYANWWCGKTTAAGAVRRIYTDPHAPKGARILGTMANSADFRKAFKCKAKKPTCELW